MMVTGLSNKVMSAAALIRITPSETLPSSTEKRRSVVGQIGDDKTTFQFEREQLDEQKSQ